MQRDRMSDGDVLAQIHAPLLLHAMQHAVVLDIGEGSNADLVHIAPQYGIHPYRSVLPEYNVPDDLRRLIDKTARWNRRADAFIGSNHALSENIEHSTSCEQ